MPNGYDLLQNISVYENDIRFLNPSEFIEVDKTYYSLSDGIVKADLFGEDTPNPYWLGNVNLK